MITSQELIERIQKNVGVPWQSQRSDGFSDGILFGSADASVTGIANTFTPTLYVLRKAIGSGTNVVICREAPSYSRGERAPLFWRNGPAPLKEMLDSDPVWHAKQEFISKNNVVIIRFLDNWDARKTDGQLRGLSRALGRDSFHLHQEGGGDAYDFHDIYFQLPKTSLNNLAAAAKKKLIIHCVRVIGKAEATISKSALTHGLLLVADAERREWEAAEYVRDAIAAGQKKALIQLPHEGGQETGMNECARWLQTFVTEVPVKFIPLVTCFGCQLRG